jgi:hypothetical protein
MSFWQVFQRFLFNFAKDKLQIRLQRFKLSLTI